MNDSRRAPVVLRIAGRAVAAPTLPRTLEPRTRSAGALSSGVADPFLPPGYLQAIEAVDVTETARASVGSREQSLATNPGEVIALELADGTTVYTSPERLDETVRQLVPDAVAGDGSVDLEALNARGGRATRDVVGAVRRVFARVTRLKVGDVRDAIVEAALDKLKDELGERVTDRIANLGVTWHGTKALMWAIESRLARKPGLYRWVAARGEPTDLLDADGTALARESAEGPFLLFIHGAASSTVGSYGDLQNASRDYWRALEARYGNRILAFEHATMSASPIDNALQLATALPTGARLDLVTHSRGGLVGDLLTLSALATTDRSLIDGYEVDEIALGDAPEDDRARLRTELEKAYAEHRATLVELGDVLRAKRFVIDRYVRVAAPARGTRLASGNLDVFLSSLLTIVGLVPALAASPLYSALKRIVLEIVKNRTRPGLVPGIEAMLPESPMARLLARATPDPRVRLAIVAGDIEGRGLLKKLGVLFTDQIFFDGGDNDLVVDTDSMYAGVARPGTARALFDQGVDVSHFRYFSNGITRRAVAAWLTSDDPHTVAEFKAFDTPDVTARTRRAVQRDPARQHLPVVVVLPGIMGSHLWVGGKDRVWFDFADLALGGLSKIAFAKRGVEAEAVYAPAYGELCAFLEKSHRVEQHPYDWRQPVDVLADALAVRLRRILADTLQAKLPVRLLAHSMGGLVVRALAHKHHDLWRQLMERDGARFVMLGTPNRGAYSMVENLLGKGDNVRKLTLVDVKHGLQDVLDIIGAFRGALQLLPASTLKTDGAAFDWYAESTWHSLKDEMRDPWFGDGLAATPTHAALQGGAWLWKRDDADGTRLAPYGSRITYVHGVAPHTAYGVTRVKDRWKMVATRRGDGTVSWDSGRIDGIGRYLFMPASHGALADTREYFSSLESLLTNDQPGQLMTSEPVSRGADDDRLVYDAGPPVYPTENELELELIGKRRRRSARARELPTLRVRVRAGDLRDCSKPILVGHYEHDPIAGAESLVDSAIVGGALSMRHNLGLYAGPLGSATVVLTARNERDLKRGRYHGAVVAGLGKFDGTLSVSALTEAVRAAGVRYLLHIHDATKAMEGAEVKGVSLISLLLGYNSSASLSIADSVGAIVRGVIEANRRFDDAFEAPLAIDELEIIELYVDTAISAGYALGKVASALNADPSTGYRVEAAREIVVSDSMRSRLEDARGASYWPRLHVTDDERSGEGAAAAIPRGDAAAEKLKFLFVGSRARAETVVHQRQPGLVDRLVAQQIHERSYDEDFSRTLFQLLIPNDFKDAARQLDQVVMVLDGYTANLPWELMLADKKPLAVTTALVRQLASSRFRSRVRQATELRAYVIGNPRTEGFEKAFPSIEATGALPPLAGAELEANTVADVLQQSGFEVMRSIGDSHASIDIVNRLYKHPYRVLHIAAHGLFEQRHADGMLRTGVVLADGMMITAAEVCAMEVVPELVFLNCCHLGQLMPGTPYNRLAYSIARELIEMGVRSVVAAGWAVDDDAAELFARTFYEALVARNAPFGDAIFEARRQVYDLFPSSITWGAYQAYGDPMWRMDPRGGAGGAARSSSTSWSPVAPEELIARLEQLRVRVRRMNEALSATEAKDIAAQADALLEGRPPAWRNRLDVITSLGSLYRDLGREWFPRAIDCYRRVVDGYDKPGRAPVAAIETLANLEARAGDYANDEAMIRTAIARLLDLARLVTRNSGGDPEPIVPALVNAERRGLLGSAYKRLAAVHARAALAARATATREKALQRMNEALAESRRWYGGPVLSLEDELRNAGSDGIHLYTASNRLFFEALERVADPTYAIAFADRCGQLAVSGGSLDANYWDATTKADAYLIGRLLDGRFLSGDLAAHVAEVAQQYRDAREGVLVGPRAVDSTIQHVALMALFFEARALAKGVAAKDKGELVAVAGALRDVVAALAGARAEVATQAGESDGDAPRDTPSDDVERPTRPPRPSRKARPKRAARSKRATARPKPRKR